MRLNNTLVTCSYFTIIEEQLERLAKHYKFPNFQLSKLKRIYNLLCFESLSGEMKLPYSGLSRINSNGVPFQWSFSFAPEQQASLRFICESGTPYTSSYKRFQESLLKIDELNALLGIPTDSWFKEQALPILMPKSSEWPKHWKSAIWFAIGANKKGIGYKIYLNLNAGEIRKRWLKIGRLLTILKRHASLKEWCDMSADVSTNSIPVGIAFDVLPNGKCGRVKVYFRSEEVTLDWLTRWYRATNGEHVEPKIRNLIEAYPLTDNKRYPNQTFFVSWEAGTNERATLKTELAVTNLNFTEQEVVSRTYSLMHKMNLPFREYKKVLSLIGYSEPYDTKEKAHKFVGVGFENDGNFHLNTYVQPRLFKYKLETRKEKDVSKKHLVDATLNNAINALFNSMINKQKWEDYHLPVGKSDIWVTAFILFQLQNVRLSIEHSQLYKNAQKWLQDQVTQTGWAYNASTPTDSDSTSLGLLSVVPKKNIAVAILRKLESDYKSAYGYGTYSSNIYKGPWSLAVDDVSPYVLLAQQKFNFNTSAEPPEFVYNNQLENGSWSSYWWTTDLYPIYGYLLYFNAIKRKPPRYLELSNYLENYKAPSIFEKALLINCLRLIGFQKVTYNITNELVHMQRANGLWNGTAILRLPSNDLLEPKSKIDGTTLYRDINGYFTTAMVINTLSKDQSKILSTM
ncbi:hypothetical protein [Ulvibacterium sp.]|uniref:hypothetical protein n=1 Tax=Ulvibacterium sp. TaxID=2665914 RepID=UPI0026164C40|nr:hypothetical protein [Ulvibacterium sp.]